MMHSLSARLIPAISCILLLATGVRGQGIETTNMERSKFFVDYAIFADSAENRLEVFYKIFNDALHYVKKGEKYVANYEVNVVVTGDKNEQITGKSVERSYVLDDYNLTRSDEGFLINQLEMPLPADQFELVCKLIDHNSKDDSSIETNLSSPDYDRSGDLSPVEFIQSIDNVPEDSPFHKEGVVAVPAVERAFDGEANDLGLYQELYFKDHAGKTVNYSYRIYGKHDDFELSGSEDIAIDGEVTRIRKFIEIEELLPGDYELDTKVTLDGKPIKELKTRFLIKWSINSLIKNDFEYAVRQLKYLISSDEKKHLMDLSETDRVQGFQDWWASKDPIKETPENELREEYYRRIRYADQYYSTVGRAGWETDRGMIYVQFGEPDDIDRHPFELDTKPYQIWRYYTQRRAFVFEDTRGDGDFQLQPPYDGDWRYIGSGVGP